MRLADRVGRRLGEPEVADLALRDELAHRADRLLDRDIGVDAVQVVEVDVVEAQALERALDRALTFSGVPSLLDRRRVGVHVALDAELGGEDERVAVAALERRAEQLLVRVRPVHLGGVEEVTPSSSARWIVFVISSSSRVP